MVAGDRWWLEPEMVVEAEDDDRRREMVAGDGRGQEMVATGGG